MPPMDIIKDKPNQDKAKSFLPTGFAIFLKNVCFFFFIFTLLFHIRFLGLPSKDWTPGFVKSTFAAARGRWLSTEEWQTPS